MVADVEPSSRFSCDVVGLESGHGGDEHERLVLDGEIVMQLHDDGTDDHLAPLVVLAGEFARPRVQLA